MKNAQSPSIRYSRTDSFIVRDARAYHVEKVASWERVGEPVAHSMTSRRGIFFHVSTSQSGISARLDQQKPAMPPVNQALLALIDSWLQEGDEREQQETWTALRAALDEDRPPDRKLFP